MKKIVIFALALCLLIGEAIVVRVEATTTASETTQWDSEAALNRVNTIGQKLMKANNLPDGIAFKVSPEDHVNAYANLNKEVYVYKGLLEYVSDDNELAAVIAHELGHIINGHCAKQTVVNAAISSIGNKVKTETAVGATSLAVAQNLASTKLSRSDEFEADLTGADLLAKAGYNPLSSVSVLNKICGNYFDLLQTHPSGEKRLTNIYDYVDYNYNQYAKTGYNSESYTAASKIISSHVAKRNASESKMNKFQKSQEKLNVKKAKREAKMVKDGSNPWETSVGVLQLFAQ